MSVHILGQTSVVRFRDPRGWVVRWWAQDGVLHYEDERKDGEYGQISDLKEALLRVQGINEMLGKSTDPGIEIDPQERKRLLEFVEQMIGLIRQARDQGNPLSRLRRLRKTTVADLPASHRNRTTVSIPKRFFMNMPSTP